MRVVRVRVRVRVVRVKVKVRGHTEGTRGHLPAELALLGEVELREVAFVALRVRRADGRNRLQGGARGCNRVQGCGVLQAARCWCVAGGALTFHF